ncbi:rhomboid family intramembrane serine protease [Halostella sp. JP-L12]|uniref:rhomboid family intramembrane serine protease n=1 Tax=Halostella TaxID=1843185 RepID=UPI000EF83E4C|nr:MULTISPECIES: rhomboid family intramembrane serine protease [Halostella]NHN49681.1 rhomboid family intramembrane serine protease [Halostella sp. JP-L12]
MSLAYAAGVVGALLVSLAVAWYADRSREAWGRRLRTRFLLGVPWGTLVSVGVVLAVYLFVQRGLVHWNDPVTLPFRAWSYLYPVGIVTAAFSHGGPSHLLGNLTGTLVLAPIVEFAWGHYPSERGSKSFSSWRTNPYVRAFAVFPGAVIGVGLLTGLFAIGPVIGFSGVVFAFAGFALVHYPLTTVVAALGVQSVLTRTYRVVLSPVVTAGTSGSPPGPPWWAEIAIQGHALGLLIGVLLGVAVAHRRDRTPGGVRVWFAVLAFAVAQGLWAVYWFRGNGEYVLYQGVGLALVAALAAVVTLAVTASERSLPALGGASRRQAAAVVLVVALAAIAGPAIPVNSLTVAGDGTPPADRSVAVDGYTVTYAEDVRNRMIPAFDVSVFGEDTDVRTSGVIVVNRDRHIWTRAVSKQRLAYSGSATVRVGGIDRATSVEVRRTGWEATGGDAAYQVWLRAEGERPRHVYNSSPATAEPRVRGKNVSVVAREGGGFTLRATEANRTVAERALPAENESVALDDLRIERRDDALYAVADGTRVRVAEKERYR